MQIVGHKLIKFQFNFICMAPNDEALYNLLLCVYYAKHQQQCMGCQQ